MAVFVVRFGSGLELSRRAYLDTNPLAYARDSDSYKYRSATTCLAELIAQRVDLNISALVLDLTAPSSSDRQTEPAQKIGLWRPSGQEPSASPRLFANAHAAVERVTRWAGSPAKGAGGPHTGRGWRASWGCPPRQDPLSRCVVVREYR